MGDMGKNAPGAPGIPPRWTTSAKSGVGTAVSRASRVWFSLSHGILNEVYYPRVDQACVRDMGLIVTDGRDFFSEEKRHTTCRLEHLGPGVPAYRLVNTCGQGRYRIVKEVLTDPRRDCLLQNTRFIPIEGGMGGYHLYVLLAPHLANRGSGNTAWVGDYKGVPMLLAAREGSSVALACSAPWLKRSAGFVGFSDGWQDLTRNRVMAWEYERAEDGNVALTAEVDITAAGGEFLLALGFGQSPAEAGNRARASLIGGFEDARDEYVNGWTRWQEGLLPLDETPGRSGVYRASASVLRTHEEKRFPGGIIASLSVPWGSSKGDDDLGGYHLVWPRDLVESAGGMLAAGARAEAVDVLYYLRSTQEEDGHWPQNMWLDGTPYWGGVQMDETAFPILLVDMALRERVLDGSGLDRLWPMVRRAARYLVRNGPVTQQDRWEEDPGYSPFTLAVEVAALLAAADVADTKGEHGQAAYLRETADNWNANIERWVYATDTGLSRRLGVEGYYMRIAPDDLSDSASPVSGFVPIKNRPPGECVYTADHIVSPDALALVRFGLRAPDDPRIVNTVRVIDAMLKVETPGGPAWRRYDGDGYGEHEDGSPFDGSGIGRPWPLLTGERAHYELAAGRREEAEGLMRAMESFAYEGGLIPEQVWDDGDIPGKGLYFGRPTGSAMPLVWAHAEYIKLLRSLRDGRVFDMPAQTVRRYIVDKTGTCFVIWRFNHRSRSMPTGKTLRVETLSQALVHWSADGWETAGDITTSDTGLGVHVADLDTDGLPAGAKVLFTFYWPDQGRWEGQDYDVAVT
jgi:glucoamylase